MQSALDCMKKLDSEEFSADECSIICMPPVPGHVTDEGNFNDNYLDKVQPVNVCSFSRYFKLSRA